MPAVPARVMALVAAVAMVAGAFALRSKLDQRKDDKVHRPQLFCISELTEFCHAFADDNTAFDVTVAAAGQTADRLAALNGDQNFDAWLTTAPWPAMVEQRRAALQGLPKLFTTDSPPVLARSPIGIGAWPDRRTAMEVACKSTLTWKCMGVVAGKRLWRDVPGAKPEWGPVKIAVGDASQEAVGLIAAAAATVDYFGRADLSTADLEDPGYQDWLSGLVRATPTTMPAFTEVLATGPSVEDALATTEAELISGLAGYARTPRPTLIYPSPVMTADLVLATVPGRAGERLRDALGDAVKKELPKQGWHVSGGEGAGGKGPVPTAPLPPANGLPDPGVLAALRNAWKAA